MSSDDFDEGLFEAIIQSEQSTLWIAWYRRHAGPGKRCGVCDVSGPCPRWLTAQRRLDEAGLLDDNGDLRAP